MRFIEPKENKIYSDFQRKGRITKCFFCGTSNNIISSHSISESRCLSLLAEDVNGKKGVYSFKHISWSNEHYYDAYNFGDFEVIGIKQASTFKGFCSCHDQKIFKLIDESDFNQESSEQCFLFCYRAFAHTFHSKSEESKRCKMDTEYKYRNYMSVEEEGMFSDLCLTCDLADYPIMLNQGS